MKKPLLIGVFLATLGIIYLKVLSPMFNIHIPCVFNLITGYDCPGCGITRASLSLLDGQFYQAFRWNMLIFILIPLYGLYHFLAKKEKFRGQSKFLMTSMLVLTVTFFILRNTETFSWLAPTFIGS